MIDESKYRGCFRGLAIGDAYGAAYEGGILEKLLWRVVGKTGNGKKRYTDDTQMSMDIARSFLANHALNQDHLAHTFAAGYRWSRGYGPSAAKLLQGIKRGGDWRELNHRRFKDGSKGNGAAMRAPIIALCHPINDTSLRELTRKSAEITHAHPLAMEGAEIIAITTCMALNGVDNNAILNFLLTHCRTTLFQSKLQTCSTFYQSTTSVKQREIKKQLGNGILATESCVTAVYFALKFRNAPLDHLLGELRALGGDTDTLGAMAGAIWGAFNGDASIDYLAKDVENIDLIDELSGQLFHVCCATG